MGWIKDIIQELQNKKLSILRQTYQYGITKKKRDLINIITQKQDYQRGKIN